MEIESPSSLFKSQKTQMDNQSPPNPSHTNFEIDKFLLKGRVKQLKGRITKLRCYTTPRAPSRRCKLYPWGIYGSYERDARKNFQEGSFDWKLKVLVNF